MVLPALVQRFAHAGEHSLLCDNEEGIAGGEIERQTLGSLRLFIVRRHASGVHCVYLPFLHLGRRVSVVVQVAVPLQDEPSSLPTLYRTSWRKREM